MKFPDFCRKEKGVSTHPYARAASFMIITISVAWCLQGCNSEALTSRNASARRSLVPRKRSPSAYGMPCGVHFITRSWKVKFCKPVGERVHAVRRIMFLPETIITADPKGVIDHILGGPSISQNLPKNYLTSDSGRYYLESLMCGMHVDYFRHMIKLKCPPIMLGKLH